MKKKLECILSAILVVITLSTVSAQEIVAVDTNSTQDTTKKDEGKPHQDLLYVDLTWEYLLGLEAPVQQKWYGRGVNLGLVYDYPFNKNGNVSGAIGLGFQSHNYYLNGIVNRYDSSGTNYSEFRVVGDTILDRGKISVNYVDVPVEFRFRTNPNKKGQRWKFAVGGKVGYLIQAHEKLIDKDKIKIKTYDYPHISQWRYGVSARVGYGSIMLSGFYSLTPFFEGTNSTSQQNALSIGISIVPF